MNNVNFTKQEEKWIPLIGKFVIDSANIEDSIFIVIEKHLKDEINKYKNLDNNFYKQLELFQEIFLDQLSHNDEDKKLLSKFIDEAKRLRQIRNLIAHNSLGLMFIDRGNGEIEMVGFEIENKSDKSISINYEGFKEAVADIKKCRSDLATLLMEYHNKEAEEIRKQIDEREK